MNVLYSFKSWFLINRACRLEMGVTEIQRPRLPTSITIHDGQAMATVPGYQPCFLRTVSLFKAAACRLSPIHPRHMGR